MGRKRTATYPVSATWTASQTVIDLSNGALAGVNNLFKQKRGQLEGLTVTKSAGTVSGIQLFSQGTAVEVLRRVWASIISISVDFNLPKFPTSLERIVIDGDVTAGTVTVYLEITADGN